MKRASPFILSQFLLVLQGKLNPSKSLRNTDRILGWAITRMHARLTVIDPTKLKS